MKKQRLLPIAVTGLIFLAAPVSSVHADNQTDLQNQVKALNERVAQLEKQLDQRSQAAAPTPRGFSSANPDVWDPLFEIRRLRSQMNQMFQDSFDRSFGPGQALLNPQTDIKQSADGYVITMDLPGMEKNNINVEVKNGMLIVSGERTAQQQVNQGNQFYRQERSFGQFFRTLPLPDDGKADDVKADYKNGVLEIKVGRMAGGKPGNASGKKIQVE